MSKITYLLKILFVTVFTGLLYFLIDYFLSATLSKANLEIIDLACYLGVIKALNVLISIAIASYIANNLVAYFR